MQVHPWVQLLVLFQHISATKPILPLRQSKPSSTRSLPLTDQTVFEGDGQTCYYPGCESKCAHWGSMLDHVRRTHMGGKLCPPVLGSVLHAKGGRYNNDRRNNRAQKIGWRPKRAAQQVDAAAPPVRTEDPGEYQRVVKRCWVKADFAGNVVYPLTVKDLCDPRCGSADVFEKTRVDSEEDNIGSETANRKGSSPSPVQLKKNISQVYPFLCACRSPA